MPPNNLLFIAEGQLGDLLLLTPAIRAVKETFPDAVVSLLIVERRNSTSTHSVENEPIALKEHGVLSTNPNINHMYSVSRDHLRRLSGLKRMMAELRIIQFLRSRHFDTVLCTFPEDRFAIWAFGSGARVRVGRKHKGFGWVFTHVTPREDEEKGVLGFYCELARLIGANVISERTEYVATAGAREWAGDFLSSHRLGRERPLVVVHPGATGDYKIWPPERYAVLMDHLRETANADVLLCNGYHDARVITAIRQHLRAPVTFLDTSAQLDRFAAILEKAALCITNDSGPRHLAVAVGTPSLAFFRQHHDRAWNPYPESQSISTVKGNDRCTLCPAGRCLDTMIPGDGYGSMCLRMITVGEAVEKARIMLAARASYPHP